MLPRFQGFRFQVSDLVRVVKGDSGEYPRLHQTPRSMHLLEISLTRDERSNPKLGHNVPGRVKRETGGQRWFFPHVSLLKPRSSYRQGLEELLSQHSQQEGRAHSL